MTDRESELTRERDDALEQRAAALQREQAMVEILSVMSLATSDARPVLAAVVSWAARLCDADSAFAWALEGDDLVFAAQHGDPKDAELIMSGARRPVADVSNRTLVGRVISAQAPVHVPDVLADPDLRESLKRLQELEGFRTMLGVPILRGGDLLGLISLRRNEVRPFSDRQIELVRTFADQSAIAIQSARLFHVVEVQRRELRRFLSPQVAELIASPDGEALLAGHRREITVVYCDLRNFTGFAETATPEDTLAVMNAYHSTLGPLISGFGGTLGYFQGDGVMVFFNDPVPIEAHALQAVRMAVAMRDAMGDLAARWRENAHELGFGCGIATGHATLGRIGFEGRYDYSAIGPVTNLAARLSSEAKAGQILISQRSFAQVKNAVDAESMGEIPVKGYSKPQTAYSILRLREQVPA